MLILAALACALPPDSELTTPAAEVPVATQARRIALALTGAPPTTVELERLDSDGLDVLIDAWLQSDRFADLTAAAHARALGLPDDRLTPPPSAGPLEGAPSGELLAALQRAPTERVRHLVTADLRWDTLLTGDQLWVNPDLASLWGIVHAAGGETWQTGRWADGRPAAGLLTDGSLHLALGGSELHRAAVLTRFLVCDDVEEPRDAGRQSHWGDSAVLEPIAAMLGPVSTPTPEAITEAYSASCPVGAPCYPLRTDAPSVAGSWYGVPARDLVELADAIRDDPRFTRCVVERTFDDLVGRPASDPELRQLTQAFTASNPTLRQLAGLIVRSGALDSSPSTPMDAARWTHALEALTGWRGTVQGDSSWGTADPSTSWRWGIGGQLDGPSAAWFRQRQAEEAAAAATDQALADPSLSPLFPEGLPSTRTEAALAHLHLAIAGEAHPNLEPSRALWDLVDAEEGPEAAWQAVVAVLLTTLSER